MRVKSFGCSIIFGSELPDDGYGSTFATPSNLTWPAHLARHLNAQYLCYARPGSGNLRIAETALIHAMMTEPTLFVIGWSFQDRFDWVDPATDKWYTIMPNDTDERSKLYYRDLHSEMRDKFTSLLTIKVVLDTLKQRNLPFIMTYQDELMFDQTYHTTPAIMDLQNYILPHMTKFDGKTFLRWSWDNNYEVTEQWHPLEQAHRAAGDYMIKVFDTQNKDGRCPV